MATSPHEDEARPNGITRTIIGCAYMASNGLGCGFLEKVYENALAHEVRKAGLAVEQQHAVRVRYDGVVVGDFKADLLVADRVIVELKAADRLDTVAVPQCLNYLRATGMPICLLMNFGRPRLHVRRLRL